MTNSANTAVNYVLIQHQGSQNMLLMRQMQTRKDNLWLGLLLMMKSKQEKVISSNSYFK